MRPETKAVHIGHEIDPSTGAVAPPIILSTTFEREGDGSYAHGYSYARARNPNRHALEQALASLEGGTEAAAFASGQAATMAVYHTLQPGDHVIVPSDIYWQSRLLLEAHYGRWGLQASVIDMTDPANIAAALRPNTRLVWVETPSNPRLRITDIRRAAELAHSVGAFCVVDNTWATSVLQQPLALGADLVMHATTKYIGGHSDVLGGCIVAKENTEIFQRIRNWQQVGGAVPSPFDCWLLLRSIPTLYLRVKAASETAKQVVNFLNQHPQVAVVHYPGLSTHPNYAVAQAQMCGNGAMFSFEVKGGAAAALEVAARVKLFTRATSLGGVESLIEHRASIEGPTSPTPPGLLRVSIGLEHVEDLIEDLAQAL